jgi:hypothetical protein
MLARAYPAILFISLVQDCLPNAYYSLYSPSKTAYKRDYKIQQRSCCFTRGCMLNTLVLNEVHSVYYTLASRWLGHVGCMEHGRLPHCAVLIIVLCEEAAA